MKQLRHFLIAALILLTVSSLAYSQRGMGGRGNRSGNSGVRGNRFYDTTTVVTISGTITAIDTVAPSNRMAGGIHLTLKNDKETIPVQLGPSTYMEQQSVKLAVNDSIDVRGSRVTFNDKPAIIAATITRGTDTLKLRSDNGIPLWSRGRRQSSGQ
jgi:hypothetical protein